MRCPTGKNIESGEEKMTEKGHKGIWIRKESRGKKDRETP